MDAAVRGDYGGDQGAAQGQGSGAQDRVDRNHDEERGHVVHQDEGRGGEGLQYLHRRSGTARVTAIREIANRDVRGQARKSGNGEAGADHARREARVAVRNTALPPAQSPVPTVLVSVLTAISRSDPTTEPNIRYSARSVFLHDPSGAAAIIMGHRRPHESRTLGLLLGSPRRFPSPADCSANAPTPASCPTDRGAPLLRRLHPTSGRRSSTDDLGDGDDRPRHSCGSTSGTPPR